MELKRERLLSYNRVKFVDILRTMVRANVQILLLAQFFVVVATIEAAAAGGGYGVVVVIFTLFDHVLLFELHARQL